MIFLPTGPFFLGRRENEDNWTLLSTKHLWNFALLYQPNLWHVHHWHFCVKGPLNNHNCSCTIERQQPTTIFTVNPLNSPWISSNKMNIELTCSEQQWAPWERLLLDEQVRALQDQGGHELLPGPGWQRIDCDCWPLEDNDDNNDNGGDGALLFRLLNSTKPQW